MRLLGLQKDKIDKLGGYNTCFEMQNQPNLWLKGLKAINENKDAIEAFLNKVYDADKLKIYMVGAGSSAKAASIVENYLRRITGKEIIALSSTMLITQPDNFILDDNPVLLVSFGSSGNTTEGLEAVRIFKDRSRKVYQILIICSAEGQIVREYASDKDVLYIPIPEGTKGKSFAATGEFTLLVQYALMIFDIHNLEYYNRMFECIVDDAKDYFEHDIYKAHAVSNKKYDAVAALGSGPLYYLASEMCLKISELSAGQQDTQFHTTLEFRHGPKLSMNKNILLTFLISNDKHTIKYDIDMLKECYSQRKNSTIAAVSMDYNEEIDKNSDYYFYFNKDKFNYLDDSHIIFQYALFLQSVAILNSVNLGVSPDMPDSSGTVNKVAQGVIIHEN